MRNTTVTITVSEEDQRILDRRWEEAGIENDYIFSCVMRKESIFLQLMQRIFPELHLSKVEKHSPQMIFYGPAGSKSVRYDVYSEIDGKVFDVEMQLTSRKNEPKRTRYYQCLMDEQVLHKGEDYAKLPDSYVVMISPQDLFHQGRHIYRFRNYEQADRNLELQDGTTKVFLNTNGTSNDILPELKNFLSLINGDEPADEFCKEVEKEVLEAKQDAETRRNFMDFEYMKMLAEIDAREKGLSEGREQGLKEGRENGLKEGREKGLKEGREKGLKEGRENGLKEGRKEGREEGLKEGIQKGEKDGAARVLVALVRDGVLTLEDAVKRSGLSDEEFKRQVSKWK